MQKRIYAFTCMIAMKFHLQPDVFEVKQAMKSAYRITGNSHPVEVRVVEVCMRKNQCVCGSIYK